MMRYGVVGIVLSIGMWICGGCAAPPAPPPAPAPPNAEELPKAVSPATSLAAGPTTRPATRQNADVWLLHAYHMKDAQPLGNFESTLDTTRLIYRVQPIGARTRPTIYFGEVRTRQDDTTVAAFIAQEKNGTMKGVILNDRRLLGCQWEWVGGGPGADEIWGVLDCESDPAPDDLALVHSTDGGANWELFRLPKPVYYATFADFAMAGDGHGRISMYVEGNYQGSVKAGYYHYRTVDGGKTWAPPQWEKDEMTAGEEVPDSEQPDPTKGM